MLVKAIAGQLPVVTPAPYPQKVVGYKGVSEGYTDIGMVLADDEYLTVNAIGSTLSFNYGSTKILKTGGLLYTESESIEAGSTSVRTGGVATVDATIGYSANVRIDATGNVQINCPDGRAGSDFHFVALKY